MSQYLFEFPKRHLHREPFNPVVLAWLIKTRNKCTSRVRERIVASINRIFESFETTDQNISNCNDESRSDDALTFLLDVQEARFDRITWTRVYVVTTLSANNSNINIVDLQRSIRHSVASELRLKFRNYIRKQIGCTLHTAFQNLLPERMSTSRTSGVVKFAKRSDNDIDCVETRSRQLTQLTTRREKLTCDNAVDVAIRFASLNDDHVSFVLRANSRNDNVTETFLLVLPSDVPAMATTSTTI